MDRVEVEGLAYPEAMRPMAMVMMEIFMVGASLMLMSGFMRLIPRQIL